MIKMIIAFLVMFGLVFFGIQSSCREKLQFAKVLGFSFVCATLALAIATGIVVLF